MKRIIQKILLVLPLILGVTSSYAMAGTSETERVWQHHINAWSSRNLEEIVSDYSEDSVIIMVNKIYRGKVQIRELFANLFKTFDRAEEHHIDPAIVTGKIVYITWRAKIDGIVFPMGTDTFVIDNGKILYQTITSNPVLF